MDNKIVLGSRLIYLKPPFDSKIRLM